MKNSKRSDIGEGLKKNRVSRWSLLLASRGVRQKGAGVYEQKIIIKDSSAGELEMVRGKLDKMAPVEETWAASGYLMGIGDRDTTTHERLIERKAERDNAHRDQSQPRILKQTHTKGDNDGVSLTPALRSNKGLIHARQNLRLKMNPPLQN